MQLQLRSCSFPNTGFEIDYYLGPGEIVHITSDGYTQLKKTRGKDADMFISLGLLWLSAIIL